MGSENNFYEKLGNIDRRILYASLLIMIGLPKLTPIPLPLPISPAVRQLYDVIEDVPNGSIIAFDMSCGPSTIPQTGGTHQNIIRQLWLKDCKIMFYCFEKAGPILQSEAIDWAIERLPEEKLPVYGEDYVRLGFLAGDEHSYAALASDIRGLVGRDMFDNSLNDLPMMEGIEDGGDFDLAVINTGSRSDYIWHLRQWTEKFGTKSVVIGVDLFKPDIQPYLASGQYAGGSLGLAEVAQYESLTGLFGSASIETQSMSLGAITATFWVIIANISYWGKRFSEKGGEEK